MSNRSNVGSHTSADVQWLGLVGLLRWCDTNVDKIFYLVHSAESGKEEHCDCNNFTIFDLRVKVDCKIQCKHSHDCIVHKHRHVE